MCLYPLLSLTGPTKFKCFGVSVPVETMALTSSAASSVGRQNMVMATESATGRGNFFSVLTDDRRSWSKMDNFLWAGMMRDFE